MGPCKWGWDGGGGFQAWTGPGLTSEQNNRQTQLKTLPSRTTLRAVNLGQPFEINHSTPHFYRPQRSCGKVIFLHLSVILFTGGCLGRHPLLGRLSLLGRHPLKQTLPPYYPLRQISPGQTPLADTPLFRHPLWANTWADTPRPGDGHCSGRFASYWNAFLFGISITRSDALVTDWQL